MYLIWPLAKVTPWFFCLYSCRRTWWMFHGKILVSWILSSLHFNIYLKSLDINSPKLSKMKKWHFRGCNISCEFGNIKRNKDHNLNFNIVPKFPKYICWFSEKYEENHRSLRWQKIHFIGTVRDKWSDISLSPMIAVFVFELGWIHLGFNLNLLSFG